MIYPPLNAEKSHLLYLKDEHKREVTSHCTVIRGGKEYAFARAAKDGRFVLETVGYSMTITEDVAKRLSRGEDKYFLTSFYVDLIRRGSKRSVKRFRDLLIRAGLAKSVSTIEDEFLKIEKESR